MSKTKKEEDKVTKMIPVRDRNGITIGFKEIETTQDKLNVFEYETQK